MTASVSTPPRGQYKKVCRRPYGDRPDEPR